MASSDPPLPVLNLDRGTVNCRAESATRIRIFQRFGSRWTTRALFGVNAYDHPIENTLTSWRDSAEWKSLRETSSSTLGDMVELLIDAVIQLVDGF